MTLAHAWAALSWSAASQVALIGALLFLLGALIAAGGSRK